MALDSTVEILVHRYLKLYKVFPFSNTTLGDVHQLTLDQIALLRFHHEQEALHRLRLEVGQWLLRNYGEKPDVEAALSNLHSLKFDINLLVKAEFMGQAIEVANAMALREGLPQPYPDAEAAKTASMCHAIEAANAEALSKGLSLPYPDVEAVLRNNSLVSQAEKSVQSSSSTPAAAPSNPTMGSRSGTRRFKPSRRLMDSMASRENQILRVVSSTSQGVRWAIDK
ncbi:hypothetical protein GYMLUDRAFT_251040 [Collybiopsis luxurians FD-317 M1]|uniref:Uncharacterized protein n=1 Tax=Collybiopsis luxurians FD-317 M1 TaxID=944289 RepID=A0A0D0BSR9_9AGAR|nr:hypothetical protein GYMLUDRAFT_251040 [Collybiopsis luxurians FD-317 M1]